MTEKPDYEKMWKCIRAFVKSQQRESNETSYDLGWRHGARAIWLEMDMLEAEAKEEE